MVPSSGWITASVEQATKAEKCENLARSCRNRYETRDLHGLSPETCPGEQKLPQRTFARSETARKKASTMLKARKPAMRSAQRVTQRPFLFFLPLLLCQFLSVALSSCGSFQCESVPLPS